MMPRRKLRTVALFWFCEVFTTFSLFNLAQVTVRNQWREGKAIAISATAIAAILCQLSRAP